MKKRIFSLFMALVTMLSFFTFPANAAPTLEEAMADVSVYAKDDELNWLTMNGSVKTQHYTYYNYRSELTGEVSEIPAYCTDPYLYGVPSLVQEGTPIHYSAESTVNDPKVMGVIANGYPHMSLASLGLETVEEAYYATKTALWCYLLSTWDISKLGVNPNADQTAAARVLQATKDIYTRGMWWDKIVSTKLTATPDRATAYAATVNGESVYQQIFTVTSGTWTLEPLLINLAAGAPNEAKILDMSNREISSLDINDATTGDDGYTWSVKVVYPADSVEGQSGSVQLNLNSVVVQYELYFARSLEINKYGEIQDYVLDTDPQIPISASAVSTYSATETPPPGGETELKICKLEAGTNTPLSGAVFEVKYPDGGTVGSFATGSDGTVTIPLTITGNYTVTETVAPADHLLPETRTQNVTVTHGKTATVTFVDAPYGNLRVEKYSDTGEALKGVTIQIKNIATGATQSAKTSSAGVALFTELPVGGYEVRETAGIEGWQLDGEAVQTVAVTTGATSTVTFINKELPGLRIVKYDRTTLQTMSGVTFEIYKDGAYFGRYTTNAMGEILITNAAPGTYLVREVQSTDTHITDTTPQQIRLVAGDGIRQLVFFNDRKPGIHLVKVDSANLSQPIANARFRIGAVDGSYGPAEFTTGADGTIDLSQLPTGAYVVTELECPGYVIDNAQRIIQLDGNETAEFVFTNSIRPTFHLRKLSSDGTPLAGIAFRIAKIEDGTSYLDRTTDANGEITIDDLDPGVYSVRETATRADHVLDMREYHVELFAGKTSTLVVENQKRPNLTVYKYDADTGEPIAGAVFTVRAADGHSVDDIRTDASGKATLANLLPGVYEVSEKFVPSDWLLDAPSELVTLYANRDHTAYFFDHKKPTLTVRKISSVTGEALAGAKFHVVYASNSTATGEINDLGYYYTGDDGAFTLTHQRDGWYKVTEVTPPTGYELNAEPQEFFLAAGKSKTVTFEDVPLSALVVFKYDSVTGAAVSGAVFQVRRLTDTTGTGGTIIGRYVTGANGSFTVTNLTKGMYIVEELSSDGNHVIDAAPQTVFLSGKDQDVVSLYFGNAPKGSLLIRKIDSATHAPLSDVRFYITDSTGAVVGNSNGYYVTDNAGTILIDGIDPGTTLIAKETAAKDGYVLDDTPQAAYIKAGQTVTLEYRNAPKGSLIIVKKDSVTGAPLKGVTFRVITSDGRFVANEGGKVSSNGLFKTDADGQIILTGLTPDTYVVTEIETIAGYVLDAEPQTVVVNADDAQTLTFTNTPEGGLLITKSDEDTGERISGVKFEVCKQNGEIIGQYTTDRNGVIRLPQLTKGWYVVTELKAASGYKLDATPQSVEVKDGQTTTLELTNERYSSITIHKTDAVTGEGIYGVTFMVYNSAKRPVEQLVTDQDGYAHTETELLAGRYYVREMQAADGYLADTEYKIVMLKTGKESVIEWENTPITGQIMVYKYAAEYNAVTGTAPGTPLSSAVYEIVDVRTGKVVDNIATDARGVAASKPLQLKRYQVREVTAPAYWQVDGTTYDVTLEFAGQIVKLSSYDKPAQLGVTLNKTGLKEVLAGSKMTYTFTVASTSNVPLTGFYFHDNIPYDVTGASVLTTGTYSARLNYRILYKTNLNEYRVLASNLLSTNNYAFQLTGLPLMAGEVVTDIYYDFGTVPAGFQSVAKPTLTVSVSPTAVNGYQVINRTDAGGLYAGTWQTANASWVTVVRNLTPATPKTLPKTGY